MYMSKIQQDLTVVFDLLKLIPYLYYTKHNRDDQPKERNIV